MPGITKFREPGVAAKSPSSASGGFLYFNGELNHFPALF
jgi:hypothetical protein